MYGQGNCYRRGMGDLRSNHDPRIGPPSVGNIFCGPITVEELKRRMEIEPERLEHKRKLAAKKKASKAAESDPLKDNKENIPESLDDTQVGTSRIGKHSTCIPLTSTNLLLLGVPNHDDSNNSSNTSNRTYTLENSGLEITSSTTALNSTYDKLEEIECSESQEVTQKSTSVITSKPPSIRNLQSYRQNPHDTIGSEISLNVDKTVENSVWEASKDTNQTNKSILSTFNNLKLDDVCGSLTDISMKSYADSPLAKALLYEEPLSETMTDYRSPSVDVSRASVNRSQTSTHHFNLKPRTTPGKMSTTLITELKAEHCLIDSFRDSTGSTKNRSTPDVFRQTTNDMWKPKPKITTKSQAPVISKIPLKKTPSKYHAIQSPVGKYIHKGISVQSMSKARHACCSKDLSMIRSKSESKIQSKIPQLSHNVRKKLELPKMAEDRTSTSAISRRSTFRN